MYLDLYYRWLALGWNPALFNLTAPALAGLALIGWLRSARRARKLANTNDKLEVELAEAAKAIEHEMKWRSASEAFAAKERHVNQATTFSARELQEFLASESADPNSLQRPMPQGGSEKAVKDEPAPVQSAGATQFI
jgi:hypothetical protein